MIKTKATFRALREECGLSQQDIADEFDVSKMTVKRWENPSLMGSEPPNDVWAFVLAARGALHEDARSIADQIIGNMAGVKGPCGLTLDYYRTQDDLDAVQAGADEPVGYVNARMRLVGQLLDRAEVPYSYRYVGE